jgi:phage/plasmid primase-like uncharacterized protein
VLVLWNGTNWFQSLGKASRSYLPVGVLARRLALRHVLIALDEGEQKTEAAAQTLADALACFGAKVYRLRLPAEHGDWNDYLVANGRAAVDRELYAAMMAALGAPALLPRS